MSKLASHFERIEHADLVNSEYVKIIDGPRDDPFPSQKVIVRPFMPDEDRNVPAFPRISGHINGNSPATAGIPMMAIM